jgi:hypothetical protein
MANLTEKGYLSLFLSLTFADSVAELLEFFHMAPVTVIKTRLQESEQTTVENWGLRKYVCIYTFIFIYIYIDYFN